MYCSTFIVSKTYVTTQGVRGTKVHDAIAIKQGDAEWAKEAMERVQGDETLGGKTLLKVDYSDQLKSEYNNFT